MYIRHGIRRALYGRHDPTTRFLQWRASRIRRVPRRVSKGERKMFERIRTQNSRWAPRGDTSAAVTPKPTSGNNEAADSDDGRRAEALRLWRILIDAMAERRRLQGEDGAATGLGRGGMIDPEPPASSQSMPPPPPRRPVSMAMGDAANDCETGTAATGAEQPSRKRTRGAVAARIQGWLP